MRMQFVGSLMTLLVIGLVGVQSKDLGVEQTTARSSEDNVWVALMDSTLKNIICGASIIDNRHALTLVRCVFGKNRNDYKLVAYEHPGGQMGIYDVDSVSFRSQNSSAENDLAIMKTVQSIRIHNTNVPVCLPFRHVSDNFLGSRIRALGWNRVWKLDLSGADVMVNRRMTVNSSVPCNNTDEYLKADDLCNGLQKQKEETLYYGGEPVFWRCPKTDIDVQVGIITSRIPDTDDRIFMLRIASFLGWIENHVFGAVKYCEYE